MLNLSDINLNAIHTLINDYNALAKQAEEASALDLSQIQELPLSIAENYLETQNPEVQQRYKFLLSQILIGIFLAHTSIKKILLTQLKTALAKNNPAAILECYAHSLLLWAEYSSFKENKALDELLEKQRKLASHNFVNLFYAVAIYSRCSSINNDELIMICNLLDPAIQKYKLFQLHSALIKEETHKNADLCYSGLSNLCIEYNYLAEFDTLLSNAVKIKTNSPRTRLQFVVTELTRLNKFEAPYQEKLSMLLKHIQATLAEGTPEQQAFNKLASVLRFEPVKIQFEELLVYAHYINENSEKVFAPHPFLPILTELNHSKPDPKRFVSAVTQADTKIKSAMLKLDRVNLNAESLDSKYNYWLLLSPISNTELLHHAVVQLPRQAPKNILAEATWAAVKIENTLLSRTLIDILEAVAYSNEQNYKWKNLQEAEKENYKCKLLLVLATYVADLKTENCQNLALKIATELNQAILSKRSKKVTKSVIPDLFQLIEQFKSKLPKEQEHLEIVARAITKYNQNQQWLDNTHFEHGLSAYMESFLKNRASYGQWPIDCINPLKIEQVLEQLRADLSIEMTHLFSDMTISKNLLKLLNNCQNMDTAMIALRHYYVTSQAQENLHKTLGSYPLLQSFCQYSNPELSMNKSLTYYRQEAWLNNALATLYRLEKNLQLSYLHGVLVSELKQAQLTLYKDGDATHIIQSIQQNEMFLYFSRQNSDLLQNYPKWVDITKEVPSQEKPDISMMENSNDTTVMFTHHRAVKEDMPTALPMT